MKTPLVRSDVLARVTPGSRMSTSTSDAGTGRSDRGDRAGRERLGQGFLS
jgi:hypothetical protein